MCIWKIEKLAKRKDEHLIRGFERQTRDQLERRSALPRLILSGTQQVLTELVTGWAAYLDPSRHQHFRPSRITSNRSALKLNSHATANSESRVIGSANLLSDDRQFIALILLTQSRTVEQACGNEIFCENSLTTKPAQSSSDFVFWGFNSQISFSKD